MSTQYEFMKRQVVEEVAALQEKLIAIQADCINRITLMIIQVFSAFWAVAMFSILTETPKKFLPYAAFSGGFAWWAYLMINNLTHSTLQAAFFSILAVAFLSHILARIMKAPVTVFLKRNEWEEIKAGLDKIGYPNEL